MPHRWLHGLIRSTWLVVAVLFVALPRTGSAHAGWRLFANPVGDLRKTLQVPVRNPSELLARKYALEQRVQALKTLVDLREALLLQEWRDEDLDEALARVDREARNVVARRFDEALTQVLRQGDARSRLAATNMLRDLDVNLRGTDRQAGAARDLAPVLIGTLRQADADLRQSAVLALGRINPDPRVAVPALNRLLQARDVAERRTAAAAQLELTRVMSRTLKDQTGLNRAGSRSTVNCTACAVMPVACRALTDPDPEVRSLSLETLQQVAVAWFDVIGEPRPAGTVEAADWDRYHADVENEAFELQPLSKICQEQMPVLIRALRDPDPALRPAAYHVLEQVAAVTLKLQFRLDSVDGWPSRQPSPPRRIVALWPSLGPAVPVLALGAVDADLGTRRAAIEVLEVFGPLARPAVPALDQALQDPDVFVRWAAARTLGKLGPVDPAATVPGLARLLVDPDLDVRLTAATALHHYGPEARIAIPALLQATQAGDAEVRVAALQALAALGPDAWMVGPAAEAAVRSTDHRVRQAAVELLGKLSPVTADTANVLKQALSDPDLAVRKTASDALLTLLPSAQPNQATLTAAQSP